MFPCERVFVETNGIGEKAEIDLHEAGIPAVGYHSKANKHMKIIQLADKVDFNRLFKITPSWLTSQGVPQNLIGRLVEANEIYRNNVRKYAYKCAHDDGIDALASLQLNTGMMRMDDKWND
jgi:hypothetical protein